MRYVFIPLVIGLMAFFACVTTTDPGDGNGDDQTTVLGTLNLFLEVWNDGDLNAYEGLLDENDFTFYFDPSDVGYEIPPSWGYEEEITAFTNLFEYVGAENVEVQLELEDVTEPEEGTDTYTVRDILYYVRVDTPERTYVAHITLDLQLTKVDGEWFITDWWDKINFLLLVEETTWGEIKYAFYEE